MTTGRVIICTFDAPGFTGGPNPWLRRWYDFVTAHGFEVLTLAFVLEPDRYRLPEDYPLLAALADRGARFETFPYWETVEKKIRWLLSRIEAFRPAVFIPNFTVAGLYATAWTRPAGLPTVGILHSDDAHHRALLDVFVAGQPRFRATDVVAVSRHITQIAQAQATPETAVHSIPYGVPLPATVSGWTQTRCRLRQRQRRRCRSPPPCRAGHRGRSGCSTPAALKRNRNAFPMSPAPCAVRRSFRTSRPRLPAMDRRGPPLKASSAGKVMDGCSMWGWWTTPVSRR